MAKKVSNKIYQFALFATAFFALLNIAGVWVVWMTGNAFGYVTGALLLIGLIACGVLAFLNEKQAFKKQWIVWLICLLVHLIFFIIACCLVGKDADYTVPALFTVMVVAILGAIIYFIFRNKVVMKNKPYNLTPTVANPGTNQESQADGDIVQKTVQIKVDQEEDKTPVAKFDPNQVKPAQPEKEEQESDTTGVITL